MRQRPTVVGMGTLTNVQKNSLYGRPGAVKAIQVQNRLRHLPRSSKGQVQVVLAHPLVADLFVEAFNAACDATPGWVPQRCDSQVIRAWRGWVKPSGWKVGDYGTSNHSWAIAWDIFSTPSDVSPPGGVWTPNDPMPASFYAEFERRGFFWGGRWKRKDTPHIEYADKPPTGPVEPNPADWLSSMLKQGDLGSEVRNLQFGLMMCGIEVEPTAIFDSPTDRAVRDLQKMAAVTVDGLVGPQTEQVIFNVWSMALPTLGDVVRQAYRVALGREPDAAGKAFWEGQTKSKNWHPSDVLREVWDSPGRAAEMAAKKPVPAPPVKPVPPAKADRLQAAVGQVSDSLANAAALMKEVAQLVEEV